MGSFDINASLCRLSLLTDTVDGVPCVIPLVCSLHLDAAGIAFHIRHNPVFGLCRSYLCLGEDIAFAGNGAHVTARSTGNDAVDSNPETGFFMPFGGNNNTNSQEADTAIVVRGGTVYAWSQVGSPEEGLDCDFSPIVIEGGTVFSVGGGMGEMPSVPTNATAKQPTVLLIGLNITKDEPITICDANGKRLDTITIPFSMRRSASLVTCPAFKLGNTYTVKTKGYEKTFTFNEPFTTVR